MLSKSMSARRIGCTGRWLLIVLLITLISQTIGQNATTDTTFQQTTEPCPNNPTTTGYTSISAMNNDMETELQYIESGNLPRGPYIFLLCPNTIFDASTEPLLPLLDGSIFICGSGAVTESCTISGGTNQVLINDSTFSPNYVVQEINFVGITFTGFTESAIAGTSGSTTTVIVKQSRFQDFQSRYVVQQENMNDVQPFSVEIDDARISSGNASIAFSNMDGDLVLDNIIVESVSFVAFVSSGSSTTQGGAATTIINNANIYNSSIPSIFVAIGNSEMNALDVSISQMKSLSVPFQVSGQGSKGDFKNINIFSNQGGSDNNNRIIGFNVSDNGQVIVESLTFTDNNNVNSVFTATNGATINVRSGVVQRVNGIPGGNFGAIFLGNSARGSIERLEVREIQDFTGVIFASGVSTLSVRQSCVGPGGSSIQAAIYESADSTIETTDNYIDTEFTSNTCSEFGFRLTKEEDGSNCFEDPTAPCITRCEPFFNATECLAQQPVTPGAPTVAPNTNSILPTLVVSSVTISPQVPGVSDSPSSVPIITVAPVGGSVVPSFSELPSLSIVPSLSIIPSLVSILPSSSEVPSTIEVPSLSLLPSSSEVPSTSEVPSLSILPSSSEVPSLSIVPSLSAIPSISPAFTFIPNPSVVPSSTVLPSLSRTPTGSIVPTLSVAPSQSGVPGTNPPTQNREIPISVPTTMPSITRVPTTSPQPSFEPTISRKPTTSSKPTPVTTATTIFPSLSSLSPQPIMVPTIVSTIPISISPTMQQTVSPTCDCSYWEERSSGKSKKGKKKHKKGGKGGKGKKSKKGKGGYNSKQGKGGYSSKKGKGGYNSKEGKGGYTGKGGAIPDYYYKNNKKRNIRGLQIFMEEDDNTNTNNNDNNNMNGNEFFEHATPFLTFTSGNVRDHNVVVTESELTYPPEVECVCPEVIMVATKKMYKIQQQQQHVGGYYKTYHHHHHQTTGDIFEQIREKEVMIHQQKRENEPLSGPKQIQYFT